MKTTLYRTVTIVFAFIGGIYFWSTVPKLIFENDLLRRFQNISFRQEKKNTFTNNSTNLTENENNDPDVEKDRMDSVKAPGDYTLLPNPNHVFQTFNNCGPATLSMILSNYGIQVSQTELRDKMRPYNNPKGDNDDKTIFSYEFIYWANQYGMEAVNRVNGNIEKLKKFTTNGFPVVVKTWLHSNEDIGHFRVVRGFDESAKVIIQDDSYQGKNRSISYNEFLALWQPFNYDYIVVYPKEKEALVLAILADEKDETVSWKNALERAKQESSLEPENIYPWFNMSTAYYHLKDYTNSVAAFEAVESRLPMRMMWYQIEPILSYKELGNTDRAIQISDNILTNHNRAFSELYMLKGEIFEKNGNKVLAKEMYEYALLYNKNYNLAKIKLEELQSTL